MKIQDHIDAMRATYGDNITTSQIMEYEASVGLKLNVANYAPRVKRGVFDLSAATGTDVTVGVKTPKAAAQPKAPKAPKTPKPPKADKTAQSPVAYKANYDSLVDLRRDFEAQGYPTTSHTSHSFTNELGEWSIVLGRVYFQPEGSPIQVLPRGKVGAKIEALIEDSINNAAMTESV